jgi:hypothetical protein
VAILRDSTPTPLGNFGFELATDGRRLAVGCPMDRAPAAIEYGSVTIFDRDPTSSEWRETGVIIPWQASPSPPQTSVLFAGAIAIDGSRLAICSEGFVAPGSAGNGRVFLFEETSPGIWDQRGFLPPPLGSQPQGLGSDLELHGDHIFVGDRNFSGLAGSHGRVLYYFFNGTSWVYVDEVRGWPGQPTSQFGQSIDVDLSAGVLAIGARLEDHNSRIDAGSVHVVRLLGDGSSAYQLVHEARLTPTMAVDQGQFGEDVTVLPDGRVAISQSLPTTSPIWLYQMGSQGWEVAASLNVPSLRVRRDNLIYAHGHELYVSMPFYNPSGPGPVGAVGVYCESAGFWNLTRVLHRPPGILGFYATHAVAGDDFVAVASADERWGTMNHVGAVAMFEGSDPSACVRATVSTSLCNASTVGCPGATPGAPQGDPLAGCLNSAGRGARLEVQGAGPSSSMASNHARAICSSLPPHATAVLIRGFVPSSGQMAFDPLGTQVGSGVLCLTGALSMFAPRSADSNGVASWEHIYWNGAPWVPGSIPWEHTPYQVWYRDHAANGAPTSNTSNAAIVPFIP